MVEIPLAAFETEGPVESLVFFGNFAGTFYLDDIALKSGAPQRDTAVGEARSAGTPEAVAFAAELPQSFQRGDRDRLPVGAGGADQSGCLQSRGATRSATGQRLAGVGNVPIAVGRT